MFYTTVNILPIQCLSVSETIHTHYSVCTTKYYKAAKNQTQGSLEHISCEDATADRVRGMYRVQAIRPCLAQLSRGLPLVSENKLEKTDKLYSLQTTHAIY